MLTMLLDILDIQGMKKKSFSINLNISNIEGKLKDFITGNYCNLLNVATKRL